VLGYRFDASTVSGDPPFFAVPFVSLRGIPALRFQGDTAGVFEIEGRYNFADRWAGIAFAGVGYTDTSAPIFDTENTIRAAGVGLRYKALKAQNVWVSPESTECMGWTRLRAWPGRGCVVHSGWTPLVGMDL